MRTLGIDFGDKNIGLAVSDALNLTAQGLGLYRKQGRHADLAYFQDLVKQYQINRIVVGLPLRMDGTQIDHQGSVQNPPGAKRHP